MNNEVTIRAFRAVDEPQTCQMFYEGHINVLRSFGVEPISSAKKGWFYNPNVYGLIAELDGRIVGGVKLHKAGGSQPLPIEEGIGYHDKRIYDLVKSFISEGTGEACGLWNAREVAGRGISYILSRTIIAITDQVGIDKLFALSSDHTIDMFREFGFRIVHSLGDNGDFVYPTPQYISRVLLMDSKTLSRALPYNRKMMLSLRENPNQRRKGKSPKGEITIDYHLRLFANKEVA